MSIVLQGSTSGSITLQEPAIAGSTVLSLPATSGTVALTSQLPTAPSAVGQIPFSTDGSTYTPTAKIVSATAVASTSGTSIDFTGIPSWVKRITVMFTAVSTNGSSIPQIQLGSGSFTTSGYLGNSFISASASAPAGSVNSAGFLIGGNGGASYSRTGIMTISLLTGNTWVSSHSMGDNINNYVYWGGGSIALSGTLDRVRITTANGTDSYDAGTINILYE